MKVPHSRELLRLDSRLRKNATASCRGVLLSVVGQWTTLSGDPTLEQYVRSWDVPKMLTTADALVGQLYPTADLHFAAHQVAALIRKYPWSAKDSRLDPEAAAFHTFVSAEKRCARMNRWFTLWESKPWLRPNFTRTFERMRQWVRFVINDGPGLRQIYDACDFTAGASVGVHGNATHLLAKLTAEKWTMTPTALPYVAAALCDDPTYGERFAKRRGVIRSWHVSENDMYDGGILLVNYNKVAFVPKTAKTHRSIAVEPLGNGFLQKGTDLYLRLHLQRVGLDLRDQVPNQEMARKGSLSCEEEDFVTIDLKSASDSISTGLCRALLPPDWFAFLNRIRSPNWHYKGQTHVYSKFCSMGNGFCFPLQTLIFASACHAVHAGKPGVDFRVYGDDIVVRKRYADSLISFLRLLGFQTNRKKTLLEGPYRESCGSNWYAGEDVTPFTFDFELSSLSSLFGFVNQARRNPRSHAFLDEAIKYVLSLIPDQFLFYRPYKGPATTGIDPFGLEFVPRWRRHIDRKVDYQCQEWLELQPSAISDARYDAQLHNWVVMAAALRGHPSSCLFAFRRKTSTRVRRVARSGPV